MARAMNLLKPHHTDIGNSERLISFHPCYRYSTEWKSWLAWDGKRFRRDAAETVYQAAKETIQRFYEEVKKQPEGTAKQKADKELALRWARESESLSRQNAMVMQARRDPRYRIVVSDLDKNGWKLNVENGTIDLKTGKLLPHEPNDLISKLSPVKFDPAAKCPTFMAFLSRVMGGNAALMEYLQRICGYTMTAKVTEKAVFCFFGKGDNGKTTFIMVMRHVMGDYGCRIMSESLMDGRFSGSNTQNSDLADLCGARFASTSEIKQGDKLSEHKLKDYTSMDVVKARKLRENPFEFQPTHKFFMDFNYRPVVEGRDQGIWGRLKLVPFTVTIPKVEQDKDLFNKLVRESSGILNWMVEGCLKYQKDGLQEPDEIIKATAEWRSEDDFIQMFVDDCCVFDPLYCTDVKSLVREFTEWVENNEAAVKKTDLIAWFGAQGHAWGTPRTIEGMSCRVVDGVRLKICKVLYRIKDKSGVEVERESVSPKKSVSPDPLYPEAFTEKLTNDKIN